MKLKTIVAVVLITLGIAAFAFQGITYLIGGRDVSFGPARRSAENTRSIPLLPIVGAIALIGGIALVLADKQDFKPAATPR